MRRPKILWVTYILKVFSLALLTWYFGPLIAFGNYEPLASEIHRLFLIGTLSVYWLIPRLWFNNVARRIFNVIKQSWFRTISVAFALAILIWYLGPLIAIAGHEILLSEEHRLVLIGFLATYWLIMQIWSVYRSKKNQVFILNNLNSSPSSNESILSAKENALYPPKTFTANSTQKVSPIDELKNKPFFLQRLAFIVIAGLCLIINLVWFYSYLNNIDYIKAVTQQVHELEQAVNNHKPNESDLLLILPLLDKARELPGGYSDSKDSIPWNRGFGLYQGDKLGFAAISLYHKLLEGIFLPRLLSRLEQQLRNNINNNDYRLETLKVYLMINDFNHFDRKIITNWFNVDWSQNLPSDVTQEQRQTLGDHLEALFANHPNLIQPVNEQLISQTRDVLNRFPIADRVYARIKLESSKSDILDFVVSEKAGRDASLVLSTKSGQPLTKRIPAFFTCAGYRDVLLKNFSRFIDQQAAENWVIGAVEIVKLNDKETKALRENILKLYLNDYIHQWDALLADIQVKPFSSQTQMLELLDIIANENSPLRQLLRAISDETNFACLDVKNKSLLEEAGSTLNTAKSRLEKILGSTPDYVSAASLKITTGPVTDHFKDLHELVQGKAGIPPPLDKSLSVLNELYVNLVSAHASGDGLDLKKSKIDLQLIIDQVKLEGRRSPFPVNKIMAAIASDSNDIVSGNVKKHINDIWRSEVLPFCNIAIQGRYPIYKSLREITYPDFSKFFGPDGIMDTFFTNHLAASVDKSTKNWIWNVYGTADTVISSDALAQFQLAETIKNIFFRMGGVTSAVSFKMKPISMSPDITLFTLDVDGQKLYYEHGPVKPFAMRWPGPNNSGKVSIEMLPPIKGRSVLSKEGPWALFRIFDEAKIKRTSDPLLFITTFNIDGREAKFEIRADSVINPFQLSELGKFKCLPNLYK
jgi:type VI secretion system protein ImpL